MRNLKWLALAFAVMAFTGAITVPGTAQDAVPMLINYQGELRSPGTGAPVADGSYDMLFRIYDIEFGGTPLWEGRYSKLNDNPIEVSNGIFSVLLGSGSGNKLDSRVFTGADRWLEIRIGSETLGPRQRIASVAYSLTDYGRARIATDLYEGGETLTGRYINSRGPDSMTGSSGGAILEVANTGNGHGIVATASATGEVENHGGRFEARGKYGRAVQGLASYEGPGLPGPVPNFGGHFESRGMHGTGVYGLTTGSNATAVVGRANNNETTAFNQGGSFVAQGGHGVGVYAAATGVYGTGLLATGSEAAVSCQGDLVVTDGAYRGNIGPNNGAPFPRPAYDSGWIAIDPDESVILSHGIGGDPDNYVVDLQFRYPGVPALGRHQRWYGGDSVREDGTYLNLGACWRRLTDEEITVQRFAEDTSAPQARVRIWVYE
jgi:hypothetical protein